MNQMGRVLKEGNSESGANAEFDPEQSADVSSSSSSSFVINSFSTSSPLILIVVFLIIISKKEPIWLTIITDFLFVVILG